MKAFAIVLVAFVAFSASLLGLSCGGQASGRYRLGALNSYTKNDLTLRGPRGRYGFYEVGYSELYGVGSYMVVGGREFKLPFRTTTSLALSVFVASLAAFYFSYLVGGKEKMKPQPKHAQSVDR